MKIIDRGVTVQKNEEDYVTSEINIMKNINTDYAVKLYYSFQNENYVFFVMDYLNGGDLGSLLENIGYFDNRVITYKILCRLPNFTLQR